jgi:hypothetical protein
MSTVSAGADECCVQCSVGRQHPGFGTFTNDLPLNFADLNGVRPADEVAWLSVKPRDRS